MSLATNLNATASSLIEKYGNTIILEHSINDGIYNPQTGVMGTPVLQQYARKAYVKPTTNDELDMDEGTWGRISSVATIIEDADIVDLDNTWAINGIKIKSVKRTVVQDTSVVTKIYYG